VAPALLLAPLAAARLASEADCVTVTVRASPPAPDEAEGCKVMVMRTPEEAVSITVAVTGSREDVAEEEEEEAASEEDEAEAGQDGGDLSSVRVPARGGNSASFDTHKQKKKKRKRTRSKRRRRKSPRPLRRTESRKVRLGSRRSGGWTSRP
jgi:hypothetical protein